MLPRKLSVLLLSCLTATQAFAQQRPFQGNVQLDVRDSKPDWDAFLYKKAPKGAPNVLFILYDDTGQATWSAYGGKVNMPTLDRLAKNGLTYTQWHTTSVCSPTRSTLLTGRNHHQNGFGSIAESAVGFAGYSGHIPNPTRLLLRFSARRDGLHSGSGRTTMCPWMPSGWALPRRTGL